MVQRSLSAFMGTTFSGLNVVPGSPTIVAQHCKNALNITVKPKSFQNKQIVVFLLCVMLVIGL
jgi:hypothetical protein